jgi:hypothetical protein
MIAILPGHSEPWRIDAQSPAPAADYRRAHRVQLAQVAQQMAAQDIEPRARWRMAVMAGFSPIEAATIAKMVRDGTWRGVLAGIDAHERQSNFA